MSLSPVILAAFMAGLLGSGHCVAMCGSVSGALSMMIRSPDPRAKVWYPWLYNLGRISSYTLAGALVGGLGMGLLALDSLGRVRQLLQFMSAVLLLLIGLRLWFGQRVLRWLDKPGRWLWPRLQPLTRRFLPVDRPARALLLGMLWGWLPCGMAWSMLLAAWMRADVVEAAALMAAFGCGTLPALLLSGRLVSTAASSNRWWLWQRIGGTVLLGLSLLSLISLGLGPEHAWMAPLGPADCVVVP